MAGLQRVGSTTDLRSHMASMAWVKKQVPVSHDMRKTYSIMECQSGSLERSEAKDSPQGPVDLWLCMMHIDTPHA